MLKSLLMFFVDVESDIWSLLFLLLLLSVCVSAILYLFLARCKLFRYFTFDFLSKSDCELKKKMSRESEY